LYQSGSSIGGRLPWVRLMENLMNDLN